MAHNHIPSQQCPYCPEIIRVAPKDETDEAFCAAMDAMCAAFEDHLKGHNHLPSWEDRFRDPDTGHVRMDWIADAMA